MKTRMSASASKTVNHRALIGKLKRFNDGIRRLFELALLPDSCENVFENFTDEPLDRREIQTYSEWKVQACFRNLNRRQKKRSKTRTIYILPIGPFPAKLCEPVVGMEISLFELIANFVAIFFHGMSVKLMDKILVTDTNCKQRLHAVTGKLQLLVSGRHINIFLHIFLHFIPASYAMVNPPHSYLAPTQNFFQSPTLSLQGSLFTSLPPFNNNNNNFTFTPSLLIHSPSIFSYIYIFIIQHIDTLPKYGKKTLDVRRST